MPTTDDYEGMTKAQLVGRLIAAESVCVMFGWAAATGNDALTEAWMEWAHIVGTGFTGPKAHPDLDEKRVYDLATKRRETRDATLKSIRNGTWGR